jgi:hypothetical protein
VFTLTKVERQKRAISLTGRRRRFLPVVALVTKAKSMSFEALVRDGGQSLTPGDPPGFGP